MSEILVSLDSISPVLGNLGGVGELDASWVSWSYWIVMDIFNIVLEGFFESFVNLSTFLIPFFSFFAKFLSGLFSSIDIFRHISNDLVTEINI